MKIKNTKELRLRASAHARLDHIAQETYGEVTKNGKVEFKGCAVGCLSTPHRKDDFLRFVDEHTTTGWDLYGGSWTSRDDLIWTLDDKDQRDLLRKEFGMTLPLVVLAEGLFEAQPTHGAAIEFVKRFAHSLREGVDITPRACDRFAEDVLELRGSYTWENVLYGVEGDGEDATESFFRFCETGSVREAVAS